MRVIGGPMSEGAKPGEFESPIVRVRKGFDSVRVTIPEGVAKPLGAVHGGKLFWLVSLNEGVVSVRAEPPGSSPRKSSKRD